MGDWVLNIQHDPDALAHTGAVLNGNPAGLIHKDAQDHPPSPPGDLHMHQLEAQSGDDRLDDLRHPFDKTHVLTPPKKSGLTAHVRITPTPDLNEKQMIARLSGEIKYPPSLTPARPITLTTEGVGLYY